MTGNAAAPGSALHQKFLRGLELCPDRDAVRIGGRGISYADVHALALTWAGSLMRACGEPPRAVGVLAAKGLESYVGVLAALYCGVPVVPLQPDFPVSRTRHMLRAARISALITDEHGYRQLPELFDAGTATPPVLRPGATGPGGTKGTVAVHEGAALGEPRPAGDIAYILFTSGSTGRPKGVLISHANLDHYFRDLQGRYGFGPEDVFSQVFSPAFDCAIFDLFAAWGSGGTVVSVPGAAYRGMTGFVTAEKITVWFSTPAAVAVVAARGGLAAGSMPTLRLSTFAGDALKAGEALAWQAAASGSVLENLYGPAETTITCSAYRWSSETSPAECLNGIVPLGRLHAGHDCLLLDADGAETGTEGELCVCGPQVSPGYLDPDDDRERFFSRGSRRWYRTGDRVRRAGNGDLLFLGRADNQVQIQGWRTELNEIDHYVRECAGVQDAVTVAVTIAERRHLVVFYTGSPSPPAEFARQLLRDLPTQLLPRHYQHLPEIPLSTTRKVDRTALRERAAGLFGTATETEVLP